MRFIVALISIIFTLDLLWLISARIARITVARIIVTIFGLAQLAGLIWLLTQRFAHAESAVPLAKFTMATVFIWHFDPSSTDATSCHCNVADSGNGRSGADGATAMQSHSQCLRNEQCVESTTVSRDRGRHRTATL
jgi:hypothetical protein